MNGNFTMNMFWLCKLFYSKFCRGNAMFFKKYFCKDYLKETFVGELDFFFPQLNPVLFYFS